MKQRWLWIALVNFFIAASMGALLRFAFVEEVSWMKFKYFLHGHSHVAMLGWIYLALYALLIHTFLPTDKRKLRAYNVLFWVTQGSVLGMMISFPIQGYATYSIAFSTIHIICSFLFGIWFWKDLPSSNLFSHQLVKTALLFMVFSTIGVWLMGPIMATQLRGSAFYYMAVQFYLHFQFNGWFLFAVLALFFKMVENNGQTSIVRLHRLFYYSLVLSCFLTYALAVAWSQPLLSIFLINGAGVIIQLFALYLFLLIVWPLRENLFTALSNIERWLLRITFCSFAFKILIQASVVIPFVAKAAYTIRNYVIGFIHLILLGAITFFLIAFSLYQNQLSAKNKASRWGIGLMLVGFLLSEGLLFLQGSMFWGAMGFLPYYYEILFVSSCLIPGGALLFCISTRFRIVKEKLR